MALGLASVNGTLELLLQVRDKHLQLAVVGRGDVLQHQEKQFQNLKVVAQVIRPTDHINVPKAYLRLLAHKGVVLTVGTVKDIGKGSHVYCSVAVTANDRKSLLNVVSDSSQCQAERIDAALQTFQEVGSHQLAQALLSSVNR